MFERITMLLYHFKRNFQAKIDLQRSAKSRNVTMSAALCAKRLSEDRSEHRIVELALVFCAEINF